jgi:hypothetical protein
MHKMDVASPLHQVYPHAVLMHHGAMQESHKKAKVPKEKLIEQHVAKSK